MQPYVDSFSTAPLRDARCSHMVDVVVMLIILMMKQSVAELVNQVRDVHLIIGKIVESLYNKLQDNIKVLNPKVVAKSIITRY